MFASFFISMLTLRIIICTFNIIIWIILLQFWLIILHSLLLKGFNNSQRVCSFAKLVGHKLRINIFWNWLEFCFQDLTIDIILRFLNVYVIVIVHNVLLHLHYILLMKMTLDFLLLYPPRSSRCITETPINRWKLRYWPQVIIVHICIITPVWGLRVVAGLWSLSKYSFSSFFHYVSLSITLIFILFESLPIFSILEAFLKELLPLLIVWREISIIFLV